MERKEELEKLKKDELVALLVEAETALAVAVAQAQENARNGDEGTARARQELETAISEFEGAKAGLHKQIEEAEARAGAHDAAAMGAFKEEADKVRGMLLEADAASEAADTKHSNARAALKRLFSL